MVTAEEAFRSLTIGDAGFLAAAEAEGTDSAMGRLDDRVSALLRMSALIALDAPEASYRAVVDAALRGGARLEDFVAVLAMLSATVGSARVMSAAPRIALAAGYDVEAALEAVEPGRVEPELSTASS